MHLVGRSFKYHRPRGILTAGSEEPNALIQLGDGAKTEPNLRATQIELFDGLIATAGVRRIRFHDLRHTCASLLLAQDVPARVVMDVLGHSQMALTMDLYSYVMPAALREAADAIDRALGQGE